MAGGLFVATLDKCRTRLCRTLLGVCHTLGVKRLVSIGRRSVQRHSTQPLVYGERTWHSIRFLEREPQHRRGAYLYFHFIHCRCLGMAVGIYERRMSGSHRGCPDIYFPKTGTSRMESRIARLDQPAKGFDCKT